MASYVTFILVFTSIVGLIFAVKNGYTYSASKNRDFEIYTSNAIDDHLNHSMLIVGDNKTDARECDLFSGTWVRDASYPLFLAAQCPYLDYRANCRQNGRPDSDYEKWRWQPSGCSIPSFDAKDMLERLRGKRLMFIGDSITKQQWQSMVCMLQAAIPSNKKTMVSQSPLTIFKALDYNASVEYFGAPFLVQRRTDSQEKRILYLDSIENNFGIYWQGIDILVFESSHWWQNQRWDLIMDDNKLYTYMDPKLAHKKALMAYMDPKLAYKKALMAWANWISANIDPKRSSVFFSTTSPTHYNPREWNETSGCHCYNQTEPVQSEGYRPAVPYQVPIVKEVLKSMRFPVTLMEITRLSQFRKDGHHSVYNGVFTSEEKKHPDKFGDCSHWCLPGVPDTWNELLYVTLLFKGFGK